MIWDILFDFAITVLALVGTKALVWEYLKLFRKLPLSGHLLCGPCSVLALYAVIYWIVAVVSKYSAMSKVL